MEEVMKTWDLLEKLIDVIFLIGRKGLAFRGYNKNSDQCHTARGNFLEFFKILWVVWGYSRKAFEENWKGIWQAKELEESETLLNHKKQEKLMKIWLVIK